MQLLRIWRMRLLGGATAAVLLPLAILVAALTVGSAGGGLRGLGSVRQALTGPAIPWAESSAAGRHSQRPRLLLERSMPPARSGARAARRERIEARRLRTHPAPDRGSRRSPGRRPGGSAPEPPASTPEPSPPERPPPGEPPSTVRRVGDRVKTVTDGVPVADEPSDRVVDTIVETVESLPVPDVP